MWTSDTWHMVSRGFVAQHMETPAGGIKPDKRCAPSDASLPQCSQGLKCRDQGSSVQHRSTREIRIAKLVYHACAYRYVVDSPPFSSSEASLGYGQLGRLGYGTFEMTPNCQPGGSKFKLHLKEAEKRNMPTTERKNQTLWWLCCQGYSIT